MQVMIFVAEHDYQVSERANGWLKGQGDKIEIVSSQTTATIQYFAAGTGAAWPEAKRVSLTIWYKAKGAN